VFRLESPAGVWRNPSTRDGVPGGVRRGQHRVKRSAGDPRRVVADRRLATHGLRDPWAIAAPPMAGRPAASVPPSAWHCPDPVLQLRACTGRRLFSSQDSQR
jgi:hypothetical protein